MILLSITSATSTTVIQPCLCPRRRRCPHRRRMPEHRPLAHVPPAGRRDQVLFKARHRVAGEEAEGEAG